MYRISWILEECRGKIFLYVLRGKIFSLNFTDLLKFCVVSNAGEACITFFYFLLSKAYLYTIYAKILWLLNNVQWHCFYELTN